MMHAKRLAALAHKVASRQGCTAASVRMNHTGRLDGKVAIVTGKMTMLNRHHDDTDGDATFGVCRWLQWHWACHITAVCQVSAGLCG